MNYRQIRATMLHPRFKLIFYLDTIKGAIKERLYTMSIGNKLLSRLFPVRFVLACALNEF